MSSSTAIIRDFVAWILAEDAKRTSDQIIHAGFRVLVRGQDERANPHDIQDIVNNIRALAGVTVVRQMKPVKISTVGGKRSVLEIDVKFFPGKKTSVDSLMYLARAIKNIHQVEIVKVTHLGGQQVARPDGKSYVF